MNTKNILKKTAFVTALGAAIVVICLVARNNAKQFEIMITNQTQRYLLTIAKTQAQSIEAFIQDTQHDLKMLAENPWIQKAIIENQPPENISGSDSYSPEKALYKHLGSNLGLYRLDANGICQSRMPLLENRIGRDYSRKPGVKYVIENHRTYISEVFESNSEWKCISICQPVFKDEAFIGIVRTVIYLSTIDNMVSHIKAGESGYAWIMDDDGIMIAHPEPEYIGKDIIAASKDALPDYNWSELKNLVAKMAKGQEGVGTYHSVWWQDQKPQPTRELTAFTPIRIGGQLWSISVSMDYGEISEAVKAPARRVFIVAESLILLFVGAGIGFSKLYKKKILLEVRAKSAQRLESEIADRKQADEKIQQQNKFLNNILESLTHPFYVIDANDYTIKMANSASKFGRLSKDSTCYALTHKRSEPCGGEHTCPLDEVKKTKKPVTVEHIHHDKDGNARNVEVHGYPIFDSEGNVIQMIEYTLDITERKQAQRRLQQRIKQLNCFYGLSKLVERPQISLEQIFQKTAELIRNAYQHPDIICVRVTFEGIQYKTDNFQKTEMSQWAHIKVRREKAGDIEVYCLKEKTENGQDPFLEEERNLLNAVAEHLGRIAERTQAREKLGLFRNLIDRSNDCIFVIEPKWGRFLDVNDRACDSLGYTRQELLGMTLKDIEEAIPDDLLWQERIKELKLKGNIIIEGRHRRKDTTTFFAETTLKLVSRGKENYIIAIARDITERKRTEERQELLTKELENINKELRDFAYIISHDLKAPLRGIGTLAEWISTDYADKLDENGREQIALLLARVGRMHNLIEGVLQYSRVGRAKEKKGRVNLNELILEVIDMLAPPENIAITVENELPTVECEQTRTTQVFQNLLSNAMKYMDKPTGQIKVGCVEEDGFWKFSVTDNGPGIEEKHFERIFQIFQTLSPRDEFESTGIGLTLVKKIVELYGGKIWVESKPGEGSTFYFTLPKQKMGVTDNAKLEANIVG